MKYDLNKTQDTSDFIEMIKTLQREEIKFSVERTAANHAWITFPGQAV